MASPPMRSNPEAVRKIFAAKGRPADHPLIVHLPSADHLPQWAASHPQGRASRSRAPSGPAR